MVLALRLKHLKPFLSGKYMQPKSYKLQNREFAPAVYRREVYWRKKQQLNIHPTCVHVI